ncbi:MAG: T9SS type A sorting domain-containing protein [Bacteroidota bacterium]
MNKTAKLLPSFIHCLSFLTFLFIVSGFVTAQPIPGGCQFVGPNLVVNPEFEDGNTGFGTSFNYRSEYTCYWGDYTIASTVVDDPNVTCYDAPGFNLQTIWAVSDRNGPGTGQFMIVDPCDPLTLSPSDSCSANNPDGTVWSQSIPVCPNSEYTFSVFAKNIYYTEAIQYAGADQNPDFELTINGDTIAGYYVDGLLSLDGSYVLDQQSQDDSTIWIQISGRWSSDTNNTANLVMKNLVEGSQGNDLAVDGIFFGLCEEDISVGVAGPTQQCNLSGYSAVTLTPTANTLASGWLSHEWYKDGVGQGIENTAPAALVISPDVNGDHLGSYELIVYRDLNGSGCAFSSTSVELIEDCGESFPVEWLSVNAKPAGRSLQIDWSTASEVNNEGFEVELAAEGASFASIGFVDGAGTTNLIQSYTFLTTPLSAGPYQIRLKQIDLDGNVSHSPIVYATLDAPSLILLGLSPNPIRDKGTITLEVDRDQDVDIQVFTPYGQLIKRVFHGHLDTQMRHELSLDTYDLASGVYLLRVQGSAFTKTSRFTVAH